MGGVFGLFGERKPREKTWFERYGKIPGLVTILVLALVALQILGYLVGYIWEPATAFKLGPMFILLAAAAAVILPLVVIHAIWGEGSVDRKDFVLIIIAGIMILFILFFFKDLVPQAFEMSIQQLQSSIIP